MEELNDQQEKEVFEKEEYSVPVYNYRALNIVAVVLGFFSKGFLGIPLILGVIGLIYSFQVDTKVKYTDINGARNAAKTAKILGIISLVVSCLFFLAIGLFLGLLVVAYTR